MDASEFMVENNIKSETELFAIVDEQKKSGKKDPAMLLYLLQQKHWVTYFKILERSILQSKKVFLSKQTHMDVIHEHSHERCADSCRGERLNCALEVLHENYIYLSPIYQYCSRYSLLKQAVLAYSFTSNNIQ